MLRPLGAAMQRSAPHDPEQGACGHVGMTELAHDPGYKQDCRSTPDSRPSHERPPQGQAAAAAAALGTLPPRRTSADGKPKADAPASAPAPAPRWGRRSDGGGREEAETRAQGGGEGQGDAGERGSDGEERRSFIGVSLAAMRKQLQKALLSGTSDGGGEGGGDPGDHPPPSELPGVGSMAGLSSGPGGGAPWQLSNVRMRRDKRHVARNALLSKVNTASLGPVLGPPPGVQYLQSRGWWGGKGGRMGGGWKGERMGEKALCMGQGGMVVPFLTHGLVKHGDTLGGHSPPHCF